MKIVVSFVFISFGEGVVFFFFISGRLKNHQERQSYYWFSIAHIDHLFLWLSICSRFLTLDHASEVLP